MYLLVTWPCLHICFDLTFSFTTKKHGGWPTKKRNRQRTAHFLVAPDPWKDSLAMSLSSLLLQKYSVKFIDNTQPKVPVDRPKKEIKRQRKVKIQERPRSPTLDKTVEKWPNGVAYFYSNAFQFQPDSNRTLSSPVVSAARRMDISRSLMPMEVLL